LKREKRPLVYVAGPYTQGSLDDNIRNAVLVADVLELTFNCAPFIPHLFHFWELMSPRPYESWLALDFDMLERCDALIRIEGHSPGGDREVKYAEQLGIPVFRAWIEKDEGPRYVEITATFALWRDEWTS